MPIYLKHNIAKRHPYLILNDDTALGFFEEGRTNSKNNKVSSDVRSVADLTIKSCFRLTTTSSSARLCIGRGVRLPAGGGVGGPQNLLSFMPFIRKTTCRREPRRGEVKGLLGG